MNKLLIYNLLILLTVGLFSCNTNEVKEPMKGDTVEANTSLISIIEKPHAELPVFWADFKKAMAGMNLPNLKKMMAFDNDEFRDEFLEFYFPKEPEFFVFLNKIKATDLVDTVDGPLQMKTKEFVWKTTKSTEDGEKYESAMYFYFAKVEGEWKFVFLLAAG